MYNTIYAPTQNFAPTYASYGYNSVANYGITNTFAPQYTNEVTNIINFGVMPSTGGCGQYGTYNPYGQYCGMPQYGMPSQYGSYGQYGMPIGGNFGFMQTISQMMSGMMRMMTSMFNGNNPMVGPHRPQNTANQDIINIINNFIYGDAEDLGIETDIADGTNVWGDPHYEVIGSDGKKIKFDHHGTAGNTYNVFSGDNLQIDGTYQPHGKDPCIIDTTTVKAGNDVLTFNKKGQATLNGETLNAGSGTLADGTTYVLKGKVLSVTPSDGTGTVNIKAEGSEMTVDPDGEFRNIGGIIGTAILENRKLSEEECNEFDVSSNYKNNANLAAEQIIAKSNSLAALLGIA